MTVKARLIFCSRAFEIPNKRNVVKEQNVYGLMNENTDLWKTRLKYANLASYYTRDTGKGKTLRKICQKCLVIDRHGWREVAYYLVNVYVKLKGKSHTIGKYCPNCEEFYKSEEMTNV